MTLPSRAYACPMTNLYNGMLYPTTLARPTMKSYMCVICGFVYEEEKGHPETGIAPGTRWEDVPEHWTCPDCGASKAEFEMIEV